jgi:hypothetical protein
MSFSKRVGGNFHVTKYSIHNVSANSRADRGKDAENCGDKSGEN